MIAGVLFDFSGTLFRIEPTESWLRAVLARSGVSMPEDEYVGRRPIWRRRERCPAGSTPQRIPDASRPCLGDP